MIHLLKQLMTGDATVALRVAKAEVFWRAFFVEHSTCSVDQIANGLTGAQSSFECLFAGLPHYRSMAKSLMPITCLAHLYDESCGFEDNERLAERVVAAFHKSYVSLEVKGGALRRATNLFGLEYVAQANSQKSEEKPNAG
jgi:hypothetical protein